MLANNLRLAKRTSKTASSTTNSLPALQPRRSASHHSWGEDLQRNTSSSSSRQPDPRWKSFLVRDIFSPLYVFLFIIFWAGLNVAGPANLLLFWNLTESAILSNPPYSWSPGAVGYSNFAFVIGGMLGLVTAGPFSDWVAKQRTKRNNGIHEAEMRLPALIPYFITTIIGIVVGVLLTNASGSGN
jgi:hypothetical protein